MKGAICLLALLLLLSGCAAQQPLEPAIDPTATLPAATQGQSGSPSPGQPSPGEPSTGEPESGQLDGQAQGLLAAAAAALEAGASGFDSAPEAAFFYSFAAYLLETGGYDEQLVTVQTPEQGRLLLTPSAMDALYASCFAQGQRPALPDDTLFVEDDAGFYYTVKGTAPAQPPQAETVEEGDGRRALRFQVGDKAYVLQLQALQGGEGWRISAVTAG